MINLLPDDTKKQIKAARLNSILVKYLFILLFASAFLILSCLGVYILLINSKPKAATSHQTSSTSSSQSNQSEYSIAKSQLDTITTNITNSKALLQNQVSYSNIIVSIGENLPPNVVLANLSLSNTNLGTPIVLSAKAKSSSDVAKTKDSLQKSQIFTNVGIQGEKTIPNDSTGYPISFSINLTINKSAAL